MLLSIQQIRTNGGRLEVRSFVRKGGLWSQLRLYGKGLLESEEENWKEGFIITTDCGKLLSIEFWTRRKKDEAKNLIDHGESNGMLNVLAEMYAIFEML